MSSLVRLFRLILSPLTWRSLSCTDQTDTSLPFSIRRNQQPALPRASQAEETKFALGMIGVGDRYLQRVSESSHCLGEADTVLLQVGFRLGGVHPDAIAP